MKRKRWLGLITACMLLLSGCGEKEVVPTQPPTQEAPAQTTATQPTGQPDPGEPSEPSEYAPVEVEFCGTWYAQHSDSNGDLMAMSLTLSGDGWAEYYYGYPHGDILEYFEGSWSLSDTQQIMLELYGGPYSWEGSESEGEHYQSRVELRWDYHGSSLLLTHEGGNALLHGAQGETILFLPFDGFGLIGNWAARSEDWGWVYELRLSDSGECQFDIYDEDDTLLVGYEGWWSVENDRLDLSVLRSYGQHPESPELDHIYGRYLVAYAHPEKLILQYEEGHILTVNMEGTGEECFGYGTAPGAVSVHYAQDVQADWSACDWVIIDDTAPVEAAFCTTVPVEDFKLVSLLLQDISEDGSQMYFEATDLFDYGTLEPDRPLHVTLTIYGTIPSYGISFTDYTGTYRLFAVTMSGYDGSLMLMEI